MQCPGAPEEAGHLHCLKRDSPAVVCPIRNRTSGRPAKRQLAKKKRGEAAGRSSPAPPMSKPVLPQGPRHGAVGKGEPAGTQGFRVHSGRHRVSRLLLVWVHSGLVQIVGVLQSAEVQPEPGLRSWPCH